MSVPVHGRIASVVLALAALGTVALSPSATAGPISGFTQATLASSATDSDLVNPWGIASSATSPFWVSDNGTGKATLYDGNGTKLGLVVSMPNAVSPTGVVFNSTSGFNGDVFLFANEQGGITGWRGALGTTAETLVSPVSGVYTGLALANIGGHGYLYAADFQQGQIVVLKGDPLAPDLAGNFVDPNLPAGYAPFNIQQIGGNIYVTYAIQNSNGTAADPGPGLGIVNVFDVNGVLQGRFATGGSLNAPWGLALAPAGFGSLAGDLLVGNFGDGTINAFDAGGVLVGTLADTGGNLLVNSGLWGLTFGNGGNGGNLTSLYFTAGGDSERDGLLGRIDATARVPEPGTAGLLLLAGWMLLRRRNP